MPPQIRPARSSDAASILAIYAPLVRETAVSFELEVPDEAEVRRRIDAVHERHPWLVLERDGALAGYAYATEFRGRAAYDATVESTVYVAADHRRAGVGRALMTALLAELDGRGVHRVVAGIALPNDPSVALHEALGFRHAGTLDEVGRKLGRWWSVGFWLRAAPGE